MATFPFLSHQKGTKRCQKPGSSWQTISAKGFTNREAFCCVSPQWPFTTLMNLKYGLAELIMEANRFLKPFNGGII